MNFEKLFKNRKEQLEVDHLNNLTNEDPFLAELIQTALAHMAWEVDDGEDMAATFDPQDGYEDHIKKIQSHLDKKSEKFSLRAISVALAEIKDPDGILAYKDTM